MKKADIKSPTLAELHAQHQALNKQWQAAKEQEDNLAQERDKLDDQMTPIALAIEEAPIATLSDMKAAASHVLAWFKDDQLEKNYPIVVPLLQAIAGLEVAEDNTGDSETITLLKEYEQALAELTATKESDPKHEAASVRFHAADDALLAHRPTGAKNLHLWLRHLAKMAKENDPDLPFDLAIHDALVIASEALEA